MRSWPLDVKSSGPRPPGQQTGALQWRDTRSSECSSPKTVPQPGGKRPGCGWPLLQLPELQRWPSVAAAATLLSGHPCLPSYPTTPLPPKKVEEWMCKGNEGIKDLTFPSVVVDTLWCVCPARDGSLSSGNSVPTLPIDMVMACTP